MVAGRFGGGRGVKAGKGEVIYYMLRNNMKRGFFCIVVVLTLFAVRAIAQEKAGMQLPQAEWTRAGDILMHTPGQELFNGVIHP